MGLIGDSASGPCKVQAPIVDVSTGYMAALAVLAALMTRAKTGRGALLDVSLFATAVALQQSAVTSFIGDGQQPAKMGSAAPYSAPNEAFQASDGWIMVAAYIGERWRRLCEILELPHLADDPQFRTSGDRVMNRAAMRAALGAAFRRRSCGEWLGELKVADILMQQGGGLRRPPGKSATSPSRAVGRPAPPPGWHVPHARLADQPARDQRGALPPAPATGRTLARNPRLGRLCPQRGRCTACLGRDHG